ncbi:septum formation initiator family protein [bacterium]|nr:septum formation initiator family protein [bacterium]
MIFKRRNEAKKRNSKRIPKKQEAPKSHTPSTGNGFYYSFLTVVLILCLFQITVSAVLNISKIISYKAKIVQITKSRDAAMATNEQLKDNIKNFSNVQGLEAIARNNLKMSGEDEVLVIINSPNEDEKPEKPKSWFDWGKGD